MNSVIRPRARDDIIRQFRWYLVEKEHVRRHGLAGRGFDEFLIVCVVQGDTLGDIRVLLRILNREFRK